MESTININTFQFFQIASILFTGLLAGLFYGYDCSVIKGLGNLQDDVYLQSFQSINKAIQNPYFFISFLGNLLVLPVTTFLSYKNGSLFYLLFVGTVIYFIAVFAVTIFGNVPLNEQLAKFNISTATTNEITTMRKAFEKSWNYYHRVRTIASMIVFGLVILSLVKQRM